MLRSEKSFGTQANFGNIRSSQSLTSIGKGFVTYKKQTY